MPKCDFNFNFIEIALQHRCSPVNLLHILRTPVFKTTTGGLLLWGAPRWLAYRDYWPGQKEIIPTKESGKETNVIKEVMCK